MMNKQVALKLLSLQLLGGGNSGNSRGGAI